MLTPLPARSARLGEPFLSKAGPFGTSRRLFPAKSGRRKSVAAIGFPKRAIGNSKPGFETLKPAIEKVGVSWSVVANASLSSVENPATWMCFPIRFLWPEKCINPSAYLSRSLIFSVKQAEGFGFQILQQGSAWAKSRVAAFSQRDPQFGISFDLLRTSFPDKKVVLPFAFRCSRRGLKSREEVSPRISAEPC